MKASLCKRLARGIAVQLLPRLVPERFSPWTEAMAAEIECIEDAPEALRFALGCVRAGLHIAIGAALDDQFGRLRRRSPRTLGLWCASIATLIGCIHMSLAMAPTGYVAMNLAALVLAAAGYALLPAAVFHRRQWADRAVFAMGLALLGTALFGLSVQGVSRWVPIGPVRLQSSLLLLPCLLVMFARCRGPLADLGLAAAALGLAMQADAALSGALAASVCWLAWRRRSATLCGLALLGIACWGLAWMRPAAAVGAPFVDDVIGSAFGAHPVHGLFLGLGLVLLIVPGWLGARRAKQEALQVFCITWGVIGAGALWGYSPTPLVGFGGSAVLGYFLSLASLPPDPEVLQTSCEMP